MKEDPEIEDQGLVESSEILRQEVSSPAFEERRRLHTVFLATCKSLPTNRRWTLAALVFVVLYCIWYIFVDDLVIVPPYQTSSHEVTTERTPRLLKFSDDVFFSTTLYSTNLGNITSKCSVISPPDNNKPLLLRLENVCTDNKNLYFRTKHSSINSSSEKHLLTNGEWGPRKRRRSWPLTWVDTHSGILDSTNLLVHGSFLFSDQGLKWSDHNIFHALTTAKSILGQTLHAQSNKSSSVLQQRPLLLFRNSFSKYFDGSLIGKVMYHSGVKELFFLDQYPSKQVVCFEEVFIRYPTTTLTAGAPWENCPVSRHTSNNTIPKNWFAQMFLPHDTYRSPFFPAATQVLIINRLRSRKWSNLDEIENALTRANISFQVVALENYSLKDQCGWVRRSTTIIGTHGAALAWPLVADSRMASIQVVSYPCSKYDLDTAVGSHTEYSMVFAKNRAILPSILPHQESQAAVVERANCSSRPPYKVNSDVDSRVNVSQLMNTLHKVDFTLNGGQRGVVVWG